VIKIEDRIKEIRNILNKIKKLKFSNIISKKASKLETVVSFLSILELAKQGVIKIKQRKSFHDMDIVRR
jgi:Uncharacterized conserved protein